jgi:hypothetical protein
MVVNMTLNWTLISMFSWVVFSHTVKLGCWIEVIRLHPKVPWMHFVHCYCNCIMVKERNVFSSFSVSLQGTVYSYHMYFVWCIWCTLDWRYLKIFNPSFQSSSLFFAVWPWMDWKDSVYVENTYLVYKGNKFWQHFKGKAIYWHNAHTIYRIWW